MPSALLPSGCAKAGGVRFSEEPPSSAGSSSSSSHVHFDEKLHDSVVMVTAEDDGNFMVKVCLCVYDTAPSISRPPGLTFILIPPLRCFVSVFYPVESVLFMSILSAWLTARPPLFGACRLLCPKTLLVLWRPHFVVLPVFILAVADPAAPLPMWLQPRTRWV